MFVNVANMRTKLNLIVNSLNSLYADYLDYYNELNGVTLNWQDPIAFKYFDNVKREQLKFKVMQEEFSSLKEIYQYFVSKYSELGDKVFYVLENKDSCINKLNNFIEKIRNIINNYDRLDTSFCSTERRLLEKEKQKLNKVISDMEQEKEILKTIFHKIENIESQIKVKLSKIDIEVIKETDLGEFLR